MKWRWREAGDDRTQDHAGEQHPHALRRRPGAARWCCSAMLAGELVLLAASARGSECCGLPRRPRPTCAAMAAPKRPSRSTSTRIFHMVGDKAELVKALGETKAVIVGHDWGAPGRLARRPVAARPVPRRVRHERALFAAGLCRHPDGAGEARHQRLLPCNTFRNRGVAEAELQQDTRSALRRLYFAAGGDPRGEGQGLRAAHHRDLARQHRRSAQAAGVAERDRSRLLHAGIRAHRLSRRLELVPQPQAQLGARRPLAAASPSASRPCSSPAAATACSRFPAAQAQARQLSEDPARICGAATSSRAPATGCSRSSRPRSTGC